MHLHVNNEIFSILFVWFNEILAFWQKWVLNPRSPDQTSNCSNPFTTETLLIFDWGEL